MGNGNKTSQKVPNHCFSPKIKDLHLANLIVKLEYENKMEDCSKTRMLQMTSRNKLEIMIFYLWLSVTFSTYKYIHILMFFIETSFTFPSLPSQL